jgi:putative oxidoreductase
MQFIPLVGRILFSAIFLMFGLNHFTATSDLVGMVPDFLPAKSIVVILTGIAIVAGGLMVLLGYRAKTGGLILAIFMFLTAVTVWMPGFLEGDMNATSMFMKDLALTGGALFVYHFGSGPKSLDDRAAA